jgi:predicted acylesterase/phospholipase RssA
MWEQGTDILDPKTDVEQFKYWNRVTRVPQNSIIFDPQSTGSVHPGRLILQNVNVISAVSGSSLAAAYLVERMYRDLPRGIGNPTMARGLALREFFNPQVKSAPHHSASWYNITERERDFNLDFCWDNSLTMPQNRLLGSDAAYDKVDEQLSKFDMNPYINAMRQNYVAPIVSGFLQPWFGRGPSYEESWQDYFGWYNSKSGQPRRLSEFSSDEGSGALPTLILNSTLTRTGSRLAFTNFRPDVFEPLAKLGPVENEYFGKQTSGENISRYDPLPGRIVTHSFLDPCWDVPLATAVHASANFPYVLPAMKIKQRDSRSGSGGMWECIDGGVDDNYGIDSVMSLLRKNQGIALRRGVLIFQIDPSFMSLDPEDSRWIPQNISKPSDAAWRSGQNTDATLGVLYLRELCALFHCQPPSFREENHKVEAGTSSIAEPLKVLVRQRDTSAPQPYYIGYASRPIDKKGTSTSPGFAVFKVRVGEAPRDQVLTYWHLDDVERRKLYGCLCSEQNGKAILAAARWLNEHSLPSR